jgi:PmbA protein
MERLMKKAMKHCDQVEVYSLTQMIDQISFQNMKLQDIESQIQSGVSLRIIKDGTLGFAYTKNLGNRDELLNNALNSLKGNVKAKFSFPRTLKVKELSTYDPEIEQLTNGMIVDECKSVSRYLKAHTKGQININAGRAQSEIRLLNSKGTVLHARFSTYYMATALLYPNSYAAIRRLFTNKSFCPALRDHLDQMNDMYNSAQEVVSVPGGPMKVMFLPEALYVFMWRLQSGASGRAVHENQSPLAKRIGKRICDRSITLMNDPFDDTQPHARSFDDEGTPCSRFPIIEKGVLKNFYYDLDYASRMETTPTGHGFKSTRWGGEPISLKPNPTVEHLWIKPGKSTFAQMLASMERGVIVVYGLGAHSGNIPNGDFSIGLSPGLYVEKGKVIGRIKDAMVAGNVYDIMKNVVMIEDAARPAFGGTFPSILFDNVNVATKT